MKAPLTPEDPKRFDEAIRRFDEANAFDPHPVFVQGEARPRELVYAERLTEWVLRLRPSASEPLRLAARCQHIRRWEIPRASYPTTREGYLKWKEDLKQRHAEIAGDILGSLGYPAPLIERVQSLNLKRGLKTDEECQVLEDALCLVFLEHQLAELAQRTPEAKLVTALRKSWMKMSPQGRHAALALKLGEREKRLLETALGSGSAGT